jgi:hypothetical protein
MKYIIYTVSILLPLLLILNFTFTEEEVKTESFTVIKVDGKITIIESGKNLSTGVLFQKNEKLSFATQESRAAVISSIGGRFVLVPNAKSGKASNLLPAMSNVATRTGAVLNTLNIINYFGEDFLLLDSIHVPIHSKEFVMNDQNFFYVKYVYENDTIAKKLKFDGKNLILSTRDIYTIDKEPVPIPEASKMMLYYTRATTSKGVFITSFNLKSPKKEVIVSELNIIYQTMKENSEEEKLDALHAYLYEFYGTVNRNNLKLWIENNLKK